MVRFRSYFDLLDDRLVQKIIKCIPGHWKTGGWRCLSSCCRRLCCLVRLTCPITVHAYPEGVLQLIKVPANRAFSLIRVLHLECHVAGGVQQWVEFADAAAAAAAAWPRLEEVALDGQPADKESECVPGCLSAALLALRAAPSLRHLRLKLSEPYSLVYLPSLTQLQELELEGMEEHYIAIRSSSQCRPLADMTHLVSLRLRSMDLSLPLPCALPPSLTRLELEGCWLGTAGWAAHPAQCEQLQELHLEASGATVNSHPTVLLQEVAQQLTGLVKLRLWQDGVEQVGGQERLQNALSRMQQVAGIDGPNQAEWWPVAPLTAAQGHPELEAHIMVPPPNMGALCNLRQLELTEWWLVVSSERTWRVLGGCSSLRKLSALHTSVAPPAGVTFPHLTRLEVTTSTSPGDTVTLLSAFPELEDLCLTIAPGDTGGHELPADPLAGLPKVATAAITLLEPLGLPGGDAAGQLAAYCSALWGVLPGLKRLALTWPCSVPLLAELPSMSALQQLSAVSFKLDAEDAGGGVCLQHLQQEATQQLVSLLGGLPRLRLVDLPLGLALSGSKEGLVMGLQQALPRLQLVTSHLQV